jgi:hypothetical protein
MLRTIKRAHKTPPGGKKSIIKIIGFRKRVKLGCRLIEPVAQRVLPSMELSPFKKGVESTIDF